MQIDFLAADIAERAAALEVLGSRLPLRARVDLDAALADALWIHGEPPPIDATAIRAWLNDGGRVLLTGPALRLCGTLCDEPVLPEVRRSVWPRNVDPRDRRGAMALPRQPLFHRFPGGVYLTRAHPDLPRVEVYWSAARWPVAGRVLAVEKRHVGCDASRAVLVEHHVGRGRVLSLGVPMRLSARDDEMDELRSRFVGDLFDYLASDHAAERSPAWPHPGAPRGIVVQHVGGGAAPMVASPCPAVAADDALRIELDAGALAEDRFFDLVGRDGQAVYGRLGSGIDEVWGRSFRAFRDLHLAVAQEGQQLAPIGGRVESAWVHPDEIGWRWRDGDASLVVRLCRAEDGDGFAFVLRGEGARLRVAVSASVDLRPFWPYPAGLHEAILVGSARGGASTTFGERLIGARCALVCDRTPARAWIRDASAPVAVGDAGAVVEFVRELVITPGDDAVVSFGGRLPAWEEAGAVARAPAAPAAFAGDARIATGAADIDRAVALVLAKTADFVVPLDARNGGLVAGHDRSRPGWFSGRPGYAWFFARDALFCDHALLPLGERALARANLALCARFQDPNGKIHHEVTPLGVVHHDAADSTPMFVDAVARYLAWTGDLEFVVALWPAVERALDHMERFDRDGDGVYENAGNGHGWMEGGPLADGVLLESYQAAFVARAWAGAGEIARARGDDGNAARCAAHAAAVREQLRARMLLEDGRFAHALRSDGGVDSRRAATTAVPWLLGFGTEGRESDALRPFASAAHLADWGTRMLPEDDPAYDPASYQAGSAWPLFTGWTALADFRWGRPDAAWLRVLPLLRSAERFAPGCVDEVFRGDVYLPRGIAAHQAWSHAAVLSAFVQGICGFGLHDGHVAFEPTLPGALDRVVFDGVQVRGTTLFGEVRREADGRDVVISLRVVGDPLELDVAPFVPGPARVDGATRDGRDVDVHTEIVGDGLRLRTRVSLEPGETELRFRVVPDLVLAVVPRALEPGQPSSGARFLGRRVAADGAAITLDFECCDEVRVPIRLPGRPVAQIDGAELVDGVLRIVPPAGEGYRPVTVALRY